MGNYDTVLEKMGETSEITMKPDLFHVLHMVIGASAGLFANEGLEQPAICQRTHLAFDQAINSCPEAESPESTLWTIKLPSIYVLSLFLMTAHVYGETYGPNSSYSIGLQFEEDEKIFDLSDDVEMLFGAFEQYMILKGVFSEIVKNIGNDSLHPWR